MQRKQRAAQLGPDRHHLAGTEQAALDPQQRLQRLTLDQLAPESRSSIVHTDAVNQEDVRMTDENSAPVNGDLIWRWTTISLLSAGLQDAGMAKAKLTR